MMNNVRAAKLASALSLAIALTACASGQTEKPLIASSRPAVELRGIQSRVFETADRQRLLRAMVAVLQHYGYAITRVSPEAFTVTAVKAGQLRLTATAYARGATQSVVRANALVPTPGGDAQVDEPAFYRDLFFEPLGQVLALTALPAPEREDEAPLPVVPAAEPVGRPARTAQK